MESHPNEPGAGQEVESATERDTSPLDGPLIAEAAYCSGAGMEFLRLKLTDGRRLFIPKEELSELKNATADEAKSLFIVSTGTGIWWPQLDDGLYLPHFLQYRWHKDGHEIAA